MVQALSPRKRTFVAILLAVTLLLAGSVFGVDWANYFAGTSLLYPALAKPGITVLAFVLLLGIGRDRLSNRDWNLLLAAFCCMLPTDILMSVVVLSPSLSVGSWVFMIGGVLSIVAHIFLIIRLGKGLNLRKTFKWNDLWLPLVIYGSAGHHPGHPVAGRGAGRTCRHRPGLHRLLLHDDVVRLGVVRRGTLPKPNAWMSAIAATCWFGTEITGEIFNLGTWKFVRDQLPPGVGVLWNERGAVGAERVQVGGEGINLFTWRSRGLIFLMLLSCIIPLAREGEFLYVLNNGK